MKERMREIPHSPGIYQFTDPEGKILYIGKAADLRKRVSSYMRADVDPKTRLMLAKAVDVSFIVTRSEVEALLLENRLIGKHLPPYNIMLRGSRRYAWILVTGEEFPRILTARDRRRKGTYYGPFTDGTARRQAVIALNKAFRLRTCRVLPRRVCLQYHIGNCSGPCEGHDTVEEYAARISDAQAVLEGRAKDLIRRLEQQMRDAAKQERFEHAQQLRDTLRAVEQLESVQVVERDVSFDEDVIGMHQEREEAVFAVLAVRRGVIAGKHEYRVPAREGIAAEFLSALYRERVPPREIITGHLDEEEARTLSEYFGQLTGGTVTVTVPQRGDKRKLLTLADENARTAATQENAGLTSLADRLNLAAPPLTIDCFDVSNHQGAENVAACVRYSGGLPDPSHYRLYNIRGVSGQDDFASMKEAVSRRYAADPLPDLIVVDGGKGQLSAAREALHAHGSVPVIAIAKREEEIFVPGLPFPIRLGPRDPGLLLLRRIRDATHRFVIGHHRGRRGKSMSESMLDHLAGIGPKRKEALYKEFGTYDNIRAATKEQLQRVLGERTGERLHEELRKE